MKKQEREKMISDLEARVRRTEAARQALEYTHSTKVDPLLGVTPRATDAPERKKGSK